MPKYPYSRNSTKRLNTCHSDLILVMTIAADYYNLTIVEGHRDKETQDRYVKEGSSWLKFPNSKHNASPSLAVDIGEYDPKAKKLTYENMDEIATFIKGVAAGLNIEIEWGGDWKKFVDKPHFELVQKG